MKVGYREGILHDPTRLSWDGAGPRPLTWSAWYPAPETAVEAPFNEELPADAWFNMGQVARNAPLSLTQHLYPTVLLSHGTGGTALSLEWLGRDLAQRGYIVIAANHHGNTAIESYCAEGFLCWWERARDLSLLLDELVEAREFAGRLDMNRVFGAGFSLGCHTMMALLGAVTDVKQFEAWGVGKALGRGPIEFPDLAGRTDELFLCNPVFRASWDRQSSSYRDTRVNAALLCAPAPPVRGLTLESLGTVDTPIEMFVGEADTEAPANDCALWLHGHLHRSSLVVLAPDVGHFVFLPEATEVGRANVPHLCVDAPGVDRGAIHDRVARTAAKLFGRI